MKLTLTLFSLLSSILSFNASSNETTLHPVLVKYETLATELFQITQNAQNDLELKRIGDKTKDLIQIGFEIMDLYAVKYPVCKIQYDSIAQEASQLAEKSLEEMESKYHDGVGLPSAPTLCYLGRSQVIHPVMNLIRLKQTFSESLRQELLHDFDEVIEHLQKIQRNLEKI